jgi:hypothetical protein
MVDAQLVAAYVSRLELLVNSELGLLLPVLGAALTIALCLTALRLPRRLTQRLAALRARSGA